MSPDRPRDPSLFVFLYAIAVLLPSIGSPCSVTGQDEYWLSLRTPLEMLERDSWWTPYLDGEPRLKKPPLLYWLIAWGYETFGIELWAARIWGVLFGAGQAVLAVQLARRLFGKVDTCPGWLRSGLLPGLFAATAIGVMVESRRAMLDLPMGFFAVLAVVLGHDWLKRRSWPHALGVGASLGLATLTKGPVPLLFSLSAGLAAWIQLRKAPIGQPPRERFPLGQALVALVVLLAIALPWTLSMRSLHPEFSAVLAEQASKREFGFQLKSLSAVVFGGLGLVAPWSLLAAHSFWSLPRRNDPQRHLDRWLVTWLICAAVPFLPMKSFERYLIPLVVPMSILATRLCAELKAEHLRRHLGIATALTATIASLFALFTLWFGYAVLLPLFLLGLAWYSVRDAFKVGNPVRTAALTGLWLAALFGGVYPAMGINRPPENLPADLADRAVVTFAASQPAYLSMQRERSIRSVLPEDPDEMLVEFDGYVFVQEQHEELWDEVVQLRGLEPLQVQQFRQFYSRKVWLRFFRPGVTWGDRWEALTSFDATPLMHPFTVYELKSDR